MAEMNAINPERQFMNTEHNTDKPSGSRPTGAFTLAGGIAVSLILLFLPFFFPPSGQTGPDTLAGIGRFHLLVLHFPAALFPLIPLFEIFKRLRPAALPLIGLAVLSAIAACILGILLAAHDGFSGALVVKHMWSCIAATILAIFVFILKMLYQQSRSGALGGIYFITLFAALCTLAFGSHQGATLVHGEAFLTEKFAPAAVPPEPVTEDSLAYAALIEPIFRDHCYACHSVAKAKGGFRMDAFEKILEGGDGGMPGIEPGNLEDSEVHYRITLDPSSKGIMPPAGEKPLAPWQIELIGKWIQSGASRTITLGELNQNVTRVR